MNVGNALDRKIDTHHHFLPQVYVDAVGLEALAAVMPNRRAPDWSVAAALGTMDQAGIATAILSISSGPEIPQAALLLRKCNDAAADLRARHPGRFGSFASLPLPDIDASLQELDYASRALNTQGVILFTNYGGRYLGDPLYAPLLAELNRRSAVVFVHPNAPQYRLTGQPPAAVLEFPFETTRTAASLIYAGAARRYPDIRFILSHAGGALPYLAHRLAGAVAMDPALAELVPDPLGDIRRFYFDTALSMNPAAIAALRTIADPSHILFGSDFPMAGPRSLAANVAALAEMAMDDDLRSGIANENAARLLGDVT